MSEIEKIVTLLTDRNDIPAVLATLVAVEGSSYRRPGARLVLFADGRRFGSISGGCLEDDVILRAEQVLQSGESQLITYDTSSENDLIWGMGLGCSGVVQIVIESIPVERPRWLSVLAENLRNRLPSALRVRYGAPAFMGTSLIDAVSSSSAPKKSFEQVIMPSPALTLFGAGDDALPLVKLAKLVGWHVTVVDSRRAYCARDRFPEADAIVVTPPESLADHLSFDTGAFVVVMTHRFLEDLKLLAALLPLPLAYLGIVGSRQRTNRLLAQLQGEQPALSTNALKKLYAPVGLDLGGATPEAVALSILAEIQCRLTGRTPIHLRDRSLPIHG